MSHVKSSQDYIIKIQSAAFNMGAEVSLILPRVYLSELPNDKLLSELGITHTISVIEQSFIPKLESIPNDHWLRLDIADRPNEDLLKHLEETTEFIRRALSESPENKVLVYRSTNTLRKDLN